MKAISPILTEEIKNHIKDNDIGMSDPYPVSTYRRLVEQVAKLSYLNKNQLLFFRGQQTNYRNKVGASTFYPSIYRGEYLLNTNLKYRFDILKEASSSLCKIFKDNQIPGSEEVILIEEIQWSILQHYSVCDTPLLDFTHSLRVAASFAQENNHGKDGFVYVFGLPYIMNWISRDPGQYIVIVRLLSICPPDALRPYFQEGYLAGTEYIKHKYSLKMDLDFSNRLIAKFKIPCTKRFWGKGFNKIPNSVLFPKGDKIEKLCNTIKEETEYKMVPKKIDNYENALRKAVHKFGFRKYRGHPHYPKGEYDYIVRNKEGKRYILEAKYWDTARGASFPSEQINKYFQIASKYKSPFVLISNVDITQKARMVLTESNQKLKGEKLIYVKATSIKEIIDELNKVI